MTLWLLPLGIPLRREAEEIVAQSVEHDLTPEEWAEVHRLRAEADRLDSSVRDKQPARSEDFYSYAVAEQQRMLVEGASDEEWCFNQERFAVPAALRVTLSQDDAGNPTPSADIVAPEVPDAGRTI